MGDSLLSVGVEKLWDLLVRESERFHGVQEQFDELKSEVETLRCFLEDADAKKHTSAMVKKAVKDVKEIVYDAEDIIETFLLKEELSKTNGIKKRIRKLACIIADRRGLAFDIEALSKRIAKVIRDMQNLSVQNVIVNKRDVEYLHERQRVMRQTFSSDNEDHLVGLEKSFDQLVGHLVKEDSSQVVSVTGMGGIGKTTLARQTFNHETVKSHFAGLAWVCVSQQFTRKYVWQTILRKLRPEYKESEMTEEEVQEKLVQVLEQQNTLIVLDDIWREDDWDMIKPMFPRNKGWKVLLTSRNEGVGLRADPTCFNFKLDCLTPEESWKLFRNIALPKQNSTEHNDDKEMEEMGKQMIKHCGGLPLAVKVLGGLLAAKYTLHEWKRVSENIRSHLVYHILYLSFEELPIYLKHCFLYLAHFPEDYAISVKKLSDYWAAEGITRPSDYARATIREVGGGYIEELVKRNMVICDRDTSRFVTLQLHDMMREVCLRKAEEENFVDIVSAENSQSPCKSRRIAVHGPVDLNDPNGMMKNPKLRSLLFITASLEASMMKNILFTRLQLLRVLDLSNAKFEGGRLPSSIGKLIHLRYLSLYGANVSHIPSSMRNLKQLLYLNMLLLTSSSLHMPYDVLNEMRELTYLALPDSLDDKVKMELGNLVKLEILGNFSTKHCSVKDVQRMTRLETLTIIVNGGCTMETLSLSLSELSRLKYLIIYGLEEDPMPILEKLLHLYEVQLSYKSFNGRRMVCSRGGFPQLTKLELYGLDYLEEWIVEEGSMPLLHTLDIRGCSKLNKWIIEEGSMPLLHTLDIMGCSKLNKWIIEEGSMPLLHTLSISYSCESLKELLDVLRFTTSLKELRIGDAPLEFKEKLCRGGEYFYKVQHIPLLKIKWEDS